MGKLHWGVVAIRGNGNSGQWYQTFKFLESNFIIINNILYYSITVSIYFIKYFKKNRCNIVQLSLNTLICINWMCNIFKLIYLISISNYELFVKNIYRKIATRTIATKARDNYTAMRSLKGIPIFVSWFFNYFIFPFFIDHLFGSIIKISIKIFNYIIQIY